MKKITTILLTVILMFTLVTAMAVSVSATDGDIPESSEAVTTTEEAQESESDGNVTAMKALAAAIVVGAVGAAGAIGMAMAISKSAESMARQPEMASKINSTMMLGIVFIETAIIYALVVAILVIFVL